ncbi:hypothetical protein M9458_042522, partial [Cirrhinus mrigala]
SLGHSAPSGLDFAMPPPQTHSNLSQTPASDGSAPPCPAIQTPAPALLPPSIPVLTIDHSASRGSLGQSAPPVSDFDMPLLTADFMFPSGSSSFLGHSSWPSGLQIPTYILGNYRYGSIVAASTPPSWLSVCT